MQNNCTAFFDHIYQGVNNSDHYCIYIYVYIGIFPTIEHNLVIFIIIIIIIIII